MSKKGDTALGASFERKIKVLDGEWKNGVVSRPSERAIGKTKRLNVVLLCHFGRTGYNILRSLRSVNAQVYLVHDQRSASLRFSRYCRVLHTVSDLNDADPKPVLDIINALHLRVGVDCVIGGDVDALVFLGKIKDGLMAPIFPMAEADTLALLHDKWQFTELCRSIGVDVPRTLLFPAGSPVDLDRIESELGFPAITKPLASYGQRGIVIWKDRGEAEAWLGTHGICEPAMIVQEVIQGQDWAISVYAENGVIKHWVSWVCPGQLDASYGVGRFLSTEFIPRTDLLAMGAKIVTATNFTGVANFDARFDEGSRSMKMFECNPRFFNRMSAARLSGVDFVRPGLPMSGTQPVTLDATRYLPWQELFTWRGQRRMMRLEWPVRPLLRDLYEMASDPLPPIMRKLAKEETGA